MALETAERRRVAIIDGDRRLDLVVPAFATVAQTLHAAGVAPEAGRDIVLEAGGREVSPAMRVDDLRDGAILVLVDLSARSTATRRRSASPRDQRPSAIWWVLGGAGVVLAAASLTGSAGFDPSVRMMVGATAALAALVAGIVFAGWAARPRTSHLAGLTGILFLGFAGGTAIVPPVPAAGVVLAVFAGLLFAAALAGVMGVMSRSGTLRAEARTALVLLLVFGAVWGIGLLMHLEPAGPAAVTLGLVPVAQRVLLSSLVDVPPGTFIDYARFQTTRWTVRQQMPDEVYSIGADDAGALVARSTARLTAGALLLVVAGVACAPVAIATFDTPDPLVLAGRIALAATTVLALLLGARKASLPAVRWIDRLGAVAIVLALLLAVIPVMSPVVLAVIAAVCLAVGAASAFLVVPAGRGVVSLTWSRAADVVEWLAIALSLPAGLLAAGAVDAVRGMMAA